MKNIAVLPVLVIIFLTFIYVNPVFCQENQETRKYGFSLGPQFGAVYGQAFEYVYPTTTKGDLLSELIWDMKPVFYSGLQVDFNRTDLFSGPGFFSSLSIKAGFPGDSGIMEDRDWDSKENDALTHFSSHTNRTEEFYWFDAAIGGTFPVGQLFFVKAFISGSFMRFSFTGRDGYGVYARKKSDNIYHPINDDPVLHNFYGKTVITYEQNWYIISAGGSIGTQLFYPFLFELSFKTSPFSYCAAKDNHVEKNTLYLDFSGWGQFIEPELKVLFTQKKYDFSVNIKYRHIGKTKGDSYFNPNNTGYYMSSNKAGAALSVLDICFLLKSYF